MDLMKNVTVAMSGGIDSAVAALLVKQMGYNVSGATMRVCTRALPDGRDGVDLDINDAKEICRQLGIDHVTYDLQEEFKDAVMKNFIETYLAGGTPNPCVVCNKSLKFGVLLGKSIENGADYIATGHYARIERDQNGRYLLKKATDDKKDQTYMLWSLSQYQLAHTLLPLGDLTKSEIRQIGESSGFHIAHKSDSQDICFIPDGDYASFIERAIGERYPSGNYIDENGNILGQHKGMIHYTIGQRKGLGISMGHHIFVTAKDPITNTVTLADEDKLFKKNVIVKGINLIPFDSFDGKLRVEAKIRYSQKTAKAYATQIDCNSILLEFDEPQRAPAKGQSAVIYDNEYVIGGGIID